MEGTPSLRTPLPEESHIQREDTAPSTSKTSARETSKDSTKIPKDPLDDFVVPPAEAPYGEGSFTPSESFPWITGLGPMLDEI